MIENTIGVTGLEVRRGGHTVLRDASFVLPSGLWALRGANGSGKSSLLRVLAGVLPFHGGAAKLCGLDLRDDAKRAREVLCYVPENAELFGYLTAREFLETVAAFRRCSVGAAVELFVALASADAADKRIASLSAGQRRKLLLSTVRCGTPRVLLLDEPTNALEQASLLWLTEALVRWRAEGRVVLVAMHAEPIAVPWDGQVEVVDGMARRAPG
ncbi:MAG: ATP-binding cassette domain-containing protein [Nannocystaceae bacterium]|nr:ATP-binding cassette domain-containing protein [Nannocystaceae bacterium]